jgi:hypothetical protein
MFWIFSTTSLASMAPALQNPKSIKFTEIPILPKYGGCGSKAFWDKFPHNDLPVRPETRVDHEKLKSILEEKRTLLLKSEIIGRKNA